MATIRYKVNTDTLSSYFERILSAIKEYLSCKKVLLHMALFPLFILCVPLFVLFALCYGIVWLCILAQELALFGLLGEINNFALRVLCFVFIGALSIVLYMASLVISLPAYLLSYVFGVPAVVLALPIYKIVNRPTSF